MKVGSIGKLITGWNVESIHFISKKNLLDFDALFIDLEAFHYEILGEFRFVQTSDSDELNTKKQVLEARTADMKSFLSHGGLAIVSMNVDPSHLYNEYSNLGAVLGYNIFHLLDILGVGRSGIIVEELLGDQFHELGVLTDFHDIFHFNYKYRFTQASGHKILQTRKGNDVVGLRLTSYSGYCYLLPQFKKELAIRDAATHEKLVQILTKLLPIHAPVEANAEIFPNWVDDYTIFDEVHVLERHKVLQQESAVINAKIDIIEVQLNEYKRLKRLIFSGDRPLELAVQQAFETFGYMVTVPEGNKDDLNIFENDFKAVIEVKGLTKSGSTMNAMQLEKWVTNYAIENNTELPKGILIVNPFKTLAPALRNETVFPKDMLDYSTARKHCLMRTEDLLAILIDFKAGLINKVEINSLLKETIGVMSYTSKYQYG